MVYNGASSSSTPCPFRVTGVINNDIVTRVIAGSAPCAIASNTNLQQLATGSSLSPTVIVHITWVGVSPPPPFTTNCTVLASLLSTRAGLGQNLSFRMNGTPTATKTIAKPITAVTKPLLEAQLKSFVNTSLGVDSNTFVPTANCVEIWATLQW